MSLEQTGEFLADAYRSAFGAGRFHSFFDDSALAQGQTVDLALAEWHAFGCFVFTHLLWTIYRSRDKVSTILDSFKPALLGFLLLNESTEDVFLNIASQREQEYIAQFQGTKGGADLAVFFGRVISRITGHFDTDSGAKGIPQASDISTNVALCSYTFDVMMHTKLALEECGPEE
jgi:hypothetical protein